MKEYIVFDIETTGLNPWYDAKVTCICAKNSNEEIFSECGNELKIINDFFNWLKKYSKDEFKLVTKTGKMFDVSFILARLAKNLELTKEHLEILNYEHFDFDDVTDKPISLNNIAKLFNCNVKNNTGNGAIKLFNEGSLEELKNYCMNDVNITEECYLKYVEELN